MPALKDFKPNPDVPYYIPCQWPLIYEKVRYDGSHGTLNLLMNLGFYSLTTYSADRNSKNAYVSNTQTSLLLGYPEIVHYFNLKFKQVDYPTFKKGLAAIAKQIKKGQLVIVSGTSYFLPYSKDYQDPDYIKNYPNPIFGVSDHWLAVSGLSEQQVWVFDPVPNKFLGPISMNNFEGFWRGNRSIQDLKAVPGIERLPIFNNFQVFTGKILNPGEAEELSWAIAKTIVFEYLRGAQLIDNDRTYYFGKQATIQLKEDFLKAVAEDSSGAAAIAYKDCFMDLRWSRYHFRGLLQDLTSLYKLPESYLNEYTVVVENWEAIGNRFMVEAEKGQISEKKLDEVLKRIDETISLENKFYENFSNTLESLSTTKVLPTLR